MGWIVQTITTGTVAFAATNIDDIIILMLFFAQVSATFRPCHIVAGRYLGFLVLILASLPGFIGGLLIPKAWIGLLGILPIIIGVSQLFNRGRSDTDVQTLSHQPVSTSERSPLSKLAALLTPQTYSVAAVTLANGGDNIGIYVPLFASCDLPMLVSILAVFFGLVGVWCWVAYRLARFPAIAHSLTRYSHAIIPFVFVGLGLFILLESKTYQLFTSAPLF
jgi:cadmium resistance transport/sequestration family protein